MIFKAIQEMLGGAETPAGPRAPVGPFGLTLGRAVSLDVMGLKVAQGLALPPPSETLVVTGYGIASLDGGTAVHRFYDDEHTMLQVMCENGVGPESVREVMLLRPWDTVSPASEAEWRVWDAPGGRIGAARFEAEGLVFERVWGDPSTPWIEPAEFTEEVAVDEGPRSLIHQKVVPYRREVSGVTENLIIAVERDLSSNDRGSVTFMIGYGLSPADVTPV